MSTFQPFMYQGPTRSSDAAKLKDWPELAREVRLANTAPERHAARVEATKLAVLRQVRSDAAETDDQRREDAAEAVALLVLDLGKHQGTTRLRWASGLGTGRWQARDGGAWESAARDALRELQAAADPAEMDRLVSGDALTPSGVMKLGVDTLEVEEHGALYRAVKAAVGALVGQGDAALPELRAWDYALRAVVSWDAPTPAGGEWLDRWLPSWRESAGRKLATSREALERAATVSQ